MTGHDLDLEACKRIPHPVAKMLVAEVEPKRPTRTAAELLREVAGADPEAHDAALARGYGVDRPAEFYPDEPEPTPEQP